MRAREAGARAAEGTKYGRALTEGVSGRTRLAGHAPCKQYARQAMTVTLRASRRKLRPTAGVVRAKTSRLTKNGMMLRTCPCTMVAAAGAADQEPRLSMCCGRTAICKSDKVCIPRGKHVGPSATPTCAATSATPHLQRPHAVQHPLQHPHGGRVLRRDLVVLHRRVVPYPFYDSLDHLHVALARRVVHAGAPHRHVAQPGVRAGL